MVRTIALDDSRGSFRKEVTLSKADVINLYYNASKWLDPEGVTGICSAWSNACAEAFGNRDLFLSGEEYDALARSLEMSIVSPPISDRIEGYWFRTESQALALGDEPDVADTPEEEAYEARLTALAFLIAIVETEGLQ